MLNLQKISKQFPFSTLLLHAGFTLVSIIYVFNLVSLFLSFAQYPKSIKVVIIVTCTVGGYLLNGYLWKKTIAPRLDEIKKNWRRLILIAIVFTLLIVSLTAYHNPLVPVNENILIQTYGAIGYSHTALEQGYGKWSIMESSDFSFDGEWNFHEGIAVHQGTARGVIRYDRLTFVSDPIRFHFYFSPQITSADAEITVNGDIYPVHIPSNKETDLSFVYTISIPKQTSDSTIYRVWLQVYPFARAAFLFIFFFFTSILIHTRTTQKNTLVIQYVLSFVLSYLFYNSLNFQNEFINFQQHNITFLILSCFVFVLIPLGIILLSRKFPHLQLWILLLIVLLAIGLRIYWIEMVPTAQVSDFGRFHHWALQLAQDKPGIFIDRYATFTRLLSLLYRIYPSIIMTYGLNIFLSLATMFALFWIGKSVKHSYAGLLAAYFFAVFPSQISMVGIVGTDIPAVTALVLSTAFLVHYLNKPKFYWLAGSSIFLGFSFMIRPPMLMYSPILILPLLFQTKKTLKQIGGYTTVIFIAFVFSIVATRAIIIPAQVENMVIEEGKNVIWPLLNGTNISEKGRNNNPDTALINSWTPEEALREGIPMVINRVFSNPIEYYKLLKIKYNYIFGNAAYGADLAFLGEDMDYKTFKTEWRYPTEDIRRGYAQFSQYSYWIVLGVALLFVLRFQTEFTHLSWINLTVLLCALGTYAIFEVQPRYQQPIIPFLILFAALFFTPPKTNGAVG